MKRLPERPERAKTYVVCAVAPVVLTDTRVSIATAAAMSSMALAVRRPQLISQIGGEMKTIAEVMTPDVEVLRPEETLRDAARAMADLDVGSLPVCDGRRLMGMITDRDITIRAVAEGKSADTAVSDVMTDDVVWCADTDSVDEVLQQMADAQIRRIPVVDANRQLVGIVALGDIALEEDDDDVDETLRDISMPT